MASKCPKCHQIIENDIVCCAEVKYTWKCKTCGKLSTGFVVPYGRCYLCGGENEVVQHHAGPDTAEIAVVRSALQFELDMYHFYRLAMQQTSDEELRGVLEELYHKEEDHLEEIEQKYHVHLEPDLRNLKVDHEQMVSNWIFEGIDFTDATQHVLPLYDRAIEMERRTRDYFKKHADTLPPGAEREVYRELAAEEEDHVAILETEREQFKR
jgi:glutamate synthase (NADPH/NADH) small chain